MSTSFDHIDRALQLIHEYTQLSTHLSHSYQNISPTIPRAVPSHPANHYYYGLHTVTLLQHFENILFTAPPLPIQFAQIVINTAHWMSISPDNLPLLSTNCDDDFISPQYALEPTHNRPILCHFNQPSALINLLYTLSKPAQFIAEFIFFINTWVSLQMSSLCLTFPCQPQDSEISNFLRHFLYIWCYILLNIPFYYKVHNIALNNPQQDNNLSLYELVNNNHTSSQHNQSQQLHSHYCDHVNLKYRIIHSTLNDNPLQLQTFHTLLDILYNEQNMCHSYQWSCNTTHSYYFEHLLTMCFPSNPSTTSLLTTPSHSYGKHLFQDVIMKSFMSCASLASYHTTQSSEISTPYYTLLNDMLVSYMTSSQSINPHMDKFRSVLSSVLFRNAFSSIYLITSHLQNTMLINKRDTFRVLQALSTAEQSLHATIIHTLVMFNAQCVFSDTIFQSHQDVHISLPLSSSSMYNTLTLMDYFYRRNIATSIPSQTINILDYQFRKKLHFSQYSQYFPFIHNNHTKSTNISHTRPNSINSANTILNQVSSHFETLLLQHLQTLFKQTPSDDILENTRLAVFDESIMTFFIEKNLKVPHNVFIYRHIAQKIKNDPITDQNHSKTSYLTLFEHYFAAYLIDLTNFYKIIIFYFLSDQSLYYHFLHDTQCGYDAVVAILQTVYLKLLHIMMPSSDTLENPKHSDQLVPYNFTIAVICLIRATIPIIELLSTFRTTSFYFFGLLQQFVDIIKQVIHRSTFIQYLRLSPPIASHMMSSLTNSLCSFFSLHLITHKVCTTEPNSFSSPTLKNLQDPPCPIPSAIMMEIFTTHNTYNQQSAPTFSQLLAQIPLSAGSLISTLLLETLNSNKNTNWELLPQIYSKYDTYALLTRTPSDSLSSSASINQLTQHSPPYHSLFYERARTILVRFLLNPHTLFETTRATVLNIMASMLSFYYDITCCFHMMNIIEVNQSLYTIPHTNSNSEAITNSIFDNYFKTAATVLTLVLRIRHLTDCLVTTFNLYESVVAEFHTRAQLLASSQLLPSSAPTIQSLSPFCNPEIADQIILFETMFTSLTPQLFSILHLSRVNPVIAIFSERMEPTLKKPLNTNQFSPTTMTTKTLFVIAVLTTVIQNYNLSSRIDVNKMNAIPNTAQFHPQQTINMFLHLLTDQLTISLLNETIPLTLQLVDQQLSSHPKSLSTPNLSYKNLTKLEKKRQVILYKLQRLYIQVNSPLLDYNKSKHLISFTHPTTFIDSTYLNLLTLVNTSQTTRLLNQLQQQRNGLSSPTTLQYPSQNFFGQEVIVYFTTIEKFVLSSLHQLSQDHCYYTNLMASLSPLLHSLLSVLFGAPYQHTTNITYHQSPHVTPIFSESQKPTIIPHLACQLQYLSLFPYLTPSAPSPSVSHPNQNINAWLDTDATNLLLTTSISHLSTTTVLSCDTQSAIQHHGKSSLLSLQPIHSPRQITAQSILAHHFYTMHLYFYDNDHQQKTQQSTSRIKQVKQDQPPTFKNEIPHKPLQIKQFDDFDSINIPDVATSHDTRRRKRILNKFIDLDRKTDTFNHLVDYVSSLTHSHNSESLIQSETSPSPLLDDFIPIYSLLDDSMAIINQSSSIFSQFPDIYQMYAPYLTIPPSTSDVKASESILATSSEYREQQLAVLIDRSIIMLCASVSLLYSRQRLACCQFQHRQLNHFARFLFKNHISPVILNTSVPLDNTIAILLDTMIDAPKQFLYLIEYFEKLHIILKTLQTVVSSQERKHQTIVDSYLLLFVVYSQFLQATHRFINSNKSLLQHFTTLLQTLSSGVVSQQTRYFITKIVYNLVHTDRTDNPTSFYSLLYDIAISINKSNFASVPSTSNSDTLMHMVHIVTLLQNTTISTISQVLQIFPQIMSSMTIVFAQYPEYHESMMTYLEYMLIGNISKSIYDQEVAYFSELFESSLSPPNHPISSPIYRSRIFSTQNPMSPLYYYTQALYFLKLAVLPTMTDSPSYFTLFVPPLTNTLALFFLAFTSVVSSYTVVINLPSISSFVYTDTSLMTIPSSISQITSLMFAALTAMTLSTPLPTLTVRPSQSQEDNISKPQDVFSSMYDYSKMDGFETSFLDNTKNYFSLLGKQHSKTLFDGFTNLPQQSVENHTLLRQIADNYGSLQSTQLHHDLNTRKTAVLHEELSISLFLRQSIYFLYAMQYTVASFMLPKYPSSQHKVTDHHSHLNNIVTIATQQSFFLTIYSNLNTSTFQYVTQYSLQSPLSSQSSPYYRFYHIIEANDLNAQSQKSRKKLKTKQSLPLSFPPYQSLHATKLQLELYPLTMRILSDILFPLKQIYHGICDDLRLLQFQHVNFKVCDTATFLMVIINNVYKLSAVLHMYGNCIYYYDALSSSAVPRMVSIMNEAPKESDFLNNVDHKETHNNELICLTDHEEEEESFTASTPSQALTHLFSQASSLNLVYNALVESQPSIILGEVTAMFRNIILILSACSKTTDVKTNHVPFSTVIDKYLLIAESMLFLQNANSIIAHHESRGDFDSMDFSPLFHLNNQNHDSDRNHHSITLTKLETIASTISCLMTNRGDTSEFTPVLSIVSSLFHHALIPILPTTIHQSPICFKAPACTLNHSEVESNSHDDDDAVQHTPFEAWRVLRKFIPTTIIPGHSSPNIVDFIKNAIKFLFKSREKFLRILPQRDQSQAVKTNWHSASRVKQFTSFLQESYPSAAPMIESLLALGVMETAKLENVLLFDCSVHNIEDRSVFSHLHIISASPLQVPQSQIETLPNTATHYFSHLSAPNPINSSLTDFIDVMTHFWFTFPLSHPYDQAIYTTQGSISALYVEPSVRCDVLGTDDQLLNRIINSHLPYSLHYLRLTPRKIAMICYIIHHCLPTVTTSPALHIETLRKLYAILIKILNYPELRLTGFKGSVDQNFDLMTDHDQFDDDKRQYCDYFYSIKFPELFSHSLLNPSIQPSSSMTSLDPQQLQHTTNGEFHIPTVRRKPAKNE